MERAIEVSGLTKRFGPTRALDGLDLSVTSGEVHGFLGPNGAGKSTTIRVLLGLLRADGGHARLLGGDPWRDAVALHRRLAYVPGDVTLWPNLTGGEVIDLLGRLRGGLDAAPARRAARALRARPDARRAGPTPRATARRSRSSPRWPPTSSCCILDEPTSGLDPLMEAVFQDVHPRGARRQGRTVLLSSHILAEVEALCDRVSIIRAGRTVESGTLAELRHLTRTSVSVELAGRPTGLAALPGVHDLRLDGHRVTLRRRHRAPRRGARRARRLGVRSAGQPAADARGAVPARLRRR